MVIAIDGPAGAGKSTVARGLARRIGFTYLDSGAMYRAVALMSLASPEEDPGALAERADIRLLAPSPGEDPRVLLDGRDVTAAIRTPEVSEAASRVAVRQRVRAALVVRQRALLSEGDWVAEGRDIGTIVAPDAQLKVFLTAEPLARARRRAAQLGADVQGVLAEQSLRDARDRERAHSPLRAADGALTLDTSQMTVEQAVERIAGLARPP
ncbi:MAG TPA: (d)CMP kinase [Solirubrobacteraceae bacterium]|nr:(d)CMP kinase [Solirubrobacteraceae bacterium]